jgi:hypothetical protein
LQQRALVVCIGLFPGAAVRHLDVDGGAVAHPFGHDVRVGDGVAGREFTPLLLGWVRVLSCPGRIGVAVLGDEVIVIRVPLVAEEVVILIR